MAPHVSTSLTRTEAYGLLSLSVLSTAILANTFQGDGEPLIASLALSGLAFSLCYAMIRWLGPTFMKAGFKGRDMSKVHRLEIPECMGAVCAAVYLLVLIIFIPFPFYKDIVAATSGGGNRDVVLKVEHVQEGRFLHRFPHSKVSSPEILVVASLADDCDTQSWLNTFPRSSLSRPLPSWALATISSIYDGVTNGGFPGWHRFPCWSSTSSTLASPRSSSPYRYSHTWESCSILASCTTFT